MTERKFNYYDSEAIAKFLSRYRSHSTQMTYASLLRRYFSFHGVSPDEYIKNKRDYQKDVEEFCKTLTDVPAKTFTTTVSTIKKFLMRNDIELKAYIWEDLKTLRKGTKAVTDDKPPEPEQMKEILMHADVKTRAMVLILASSGMRVGELVKIQLDDLVLDSDPIKIKIRGSYTKSGDKRYVFISNEARDALNQWLKVRSAYIIKVQKKRNGYIKAQEKRDNTAKAQNKKRITYPSKKNTKKVFPISTTLVRFLWNNCLEKAGYDELDKTTQRHVRHIHTLRKFFASNMKLKIPEVIVEALMGHGAYLSEAYSRYSEKQIIDFYLQGVSSVMIMETQPDLTAINESLYEKDKEIDQLRRDMETMRNQMNILMADKLIKMDKAKD
jgi:integrase